MKLKLGKPINIHNDVIMSANNFGLNSHLYISASLCNDILVKIRRSIWESHIISLGNILWNGVKYTYEVETR